MSSKPTFYIVGTPKSGTTSLFSYLDQHPEVFVPEVKEPHFFSCPEIKNTYYKKAKIIDSLSDYEALYKGALAFKAIGDFSSSYLKNPNSAKRIKKYTPDAKVVIVLRNPIERAISHYLMDYSLGYISVPLMDILSNKHTHAEYYEQYVELGFYEEQLQTYFQVFSAENIHIILSEQFFAATDTTVKQLFEFIEVDPDFKPNFEKKHNQYKEARLPALKKLRTSKSLKKIMGKTPPRVKRILGSLVFNSNADKPKLQKEREFLNKIFQPHIKETEKMLGQKLDLWS